MPDPGRRDFLKLFGAAGTGALLGGCSEPTRHLVPYINPPEDIVAGRASYYATTCRECPAGCGVLAKNRDGRVIKVEGNPIHPVSGGKLCMRGQASVHGLYNPDRYPGPMRRQQGGELGRISWDEGLGALGSKLDDIVKKGRGERIVFMTELITGSLADLAGHWLSEFGQPGGPVIYEPYAFEPLRKANRVVFGRDAVPSYKIDRADFLISFNAGFLETWISNLEYARQFADFHQLNGERKNSFIFVGPRLSMTANNADLWVATRPGMEYAVGLGMIRVMLDENLVPDLAPERRAALAAMSANWPLEKAASTAGCDPKLIRIAAAGFAKAERPLAIAEGLSFSVPNAVETAVAANFLCTMKPAGIEAIRFDEESSYTRAAGADTIKEITTRMKAGEVDLLLVYGVNPAYSLPKSWKFAEAMQSVPTVVSFASAVDETASLAHMVLPAHTPLESWGDYSPRTGVTGFLQPVMGPVFDTKHIGDVLIATGKKAKGAERFPWKDYRGALDAYWERAWSEAGGKGAFDSFRRDGLMRGGYWTSAGPDAALQPPPAPTAFKFPEPDQGPKQGEGLPLVIYPTIQFFDGREANRMWVQEIPDPMTQVTWGGWVEIHPETAQKLGIEKEQVLLLKTPHGSIEVPALPIYTVPRGTLAIPVGQGHTRFGRFADGLPANPMELLPGEIDAVSGGIARPPLHADIHRTGRTLAIANTDGSYFQHGREIVVTMGLDEVKKAAASGKKPKIDYPLPSGYEKSRDFYPPHEHKDYRWCMVVDLDRCIGCGACVTACYAENNVAVVGKKQVVMGREMSWIRVQRYFDDDARGAKWLVMLCQHCDNAPCEYVCPVYAPHHTDEGLNTQVYNRCFGTRFCSQNDPYKVRRFNFFTYTRPEPLNWQLNPGVTVRMKGVMEKCSFCIQRIIEAKLHAKGEGRKVRDGEFTTACAQTCPTGALIFGSLLDPESRVSRLINDVRAHQVLAHLNTKPAVIYLKKVIKDMVA
ncbi:MAG: molybdopterin-dependent oxidoreductase [Syntrophobacteraceae bacterium]